MKGKNKIIYLGLMIFGGVFIFSTPILAHPGGTDSSGCHTCRTNCSSWGLSYGEYHCHQSKGLPQPESPITCKYGIGCESAPQYESPSYSYPSTPSCPSMSYYDSISSSCKCYSGYIASGGKCISTDQYCRDSLGFNARYNILTDSCECGYGYVISGNNCISGDTLCRNQYGIFSSYDSLSEKCKCDYSYVFDSNNQCVSRDGYCQNLYGYNAEYNIPKDTCACKSGYIFDSSTSNCIDGNSYCHNNYGYHSDYNSWSKTCECDTGYILKNNECVTPEISRIYPLEVEVGEDVTIQGDNFGDNKYGGLKLYVGSIMVNLSDISIWQNDKIVFSAGDYLESGYIVLKDSTTNIRSSYLEVLEPKEEYIPVYSPQPIKEPQLKQEVISPSQETTQTKPQQKTQSSEEIKSEPQSSVEEPQLSKPQELKGGEQDGRGNVVINNQQEQKQGQKKSVAAFLANVFNAAQSFFGRFFR